MKDNLVKDRLVMYLWGIAVVLFVGFMVAFMGSWSSIPELEAARFWLLGASLFCGVVSVVLFTSKRFEESEESEVK